MATNARKKGGARQALIVDLPENAGGNSPETGDETPPKTAADEQISTAVEAEAQGADALIYRADPSTGKEAFLDRVSAEMVSSEWLGKEYGGGKYRVQFRKPGPTGGAFTYGGQKRYEVDPDIPRKPPRWARQAASGEVKNADGTPAGESSIDKVLSTGILSLFTQQQENSRMQADWFRTMMDSRAKAPGIVEILAAVTPILAIVKELFTANRASTAPAKDPIELAKELLELRGATPAATEAKSAVAQLKEVLELREMLQGLGGGGESEEDPMVKLIGLLGPKIIDAIQNAQQIDANRSGQPAASATTTARATALPPTPERAATAATPAAEIPTGKAGSESRAAAPPPAQGEAPTMDMAMAYINSRLDKITKLAKADKSPDLYAMLEEDILPEAFKPAAREFVSQPNFIDQIFEAHPNLNEWHDWFEDFFETFRDALLGELEDEDEEGGEAGAEEERAGDATDGAGASLPNNGEVVRADIPADSSVTKGSRNGTVE